MVVIMERQMLNCILWKHFANSQMGYADYWDTRQEKERLNIQNEKNERIIKLS